MEGTVSELGIKITGIESIDRAIRSLSSLSQASGKSERDISGLSNELSKAAKTSADASKKIDDLASVAKSAGSVIAAAFSISSIVRYADSWSDMTSQVQASISAHQDAAEVMAELANIARITYSPLEATADSFVKNSFVLAQLGKTTQEQIQYTEALNNALVVSGAKAHAFELVQNAMNRAMAEGAARGNELDVVLNYGTRIAAALAEELGVTTLELRGLAKEGKITGDVIYNALINNMDQLRNEAEAMPATISDSFVLIRNAVLETIGVFDQQNVLSERVAVAFVALADNMRAIVSVLAGATVGWVSYQAAVNGTAIALRLAAVAQTIFNTAAKANPILLIGSIVAGVATAMYGLKDVTVEISGVTTRLGDIATAAWNKISGAATWAADLTQSAWNSAVITFVRLTDGLVDAFSWAWGKIAEGARNDINLIVSAMVGLKDTSLIAIDAIGKAWGSLLDLDFSDLKRTASEAAAEIAKAWQQNEGRDWIGDAGAAMREFAEDVKNGAAALASARKGSEELGGSVSSLARETKELSKEGNDFLSNLAKQAREFGKTRIEILRMEAAYHGVADAAEKYISQIEREEQALDEAQRARERYTKWIDENNALTEAAMTQQEKWNDALADLADRLSQGGISIETYRRHIEAIAEEMIEAEKEAEKSFDHMDQYAIQAARNIQTAFANYLYDPFKDGLKGMLSGFVDMLRRMAAEAASSRIIQSLGVGLGGFGISSSASAAGFGIMDAASMGSTFLSIVKGGFGASGVMGSAITSMGNLFGSSAASAFGMGMAGNIGPVASGATYGSALGSAGTMGSMAGTALGALGAGAAGIGIGSLLAGNKKIFGLSGTMTSAGGAVTGAAIGSIVPGIGTAIGALAGGVIGGAVNALFGRGPLKQRDTVLSGTIGTGGFESGSLQTNFRAKGGLFRSNKNDFTRVDAVTGEVTTDNKKLMDFANGLADVADGIIYLFDSTAKTVSTSLRGIGQNLNISTDALDAFNREIKLVSEKGEFLTDEQIAEEIAAIAEEMARTLMPTLDDFAKYGETAVQTLDRLNAEFLVLSDAALILGRSIEDTRAMISAVGFAERSDFIEAAGGMDALAQKATFFADNFLDDAARLQPAIEMLDEQLKELGLSSDLTREQFKALVQSYGQVDGISEQMLLSLLDLQYLFVRVKDGVEALNPELNKTADAARRLADAERAITDKRSELAQAYRKEHSELIRIADRFTTLSQSLRNASDQLSLGNLSPLTPEQRLVEARRQLERDWELGTSGDEAAQNRFSESVRRFVEASQAFNASSPEFVADFEWARSLLESGAIMAKTEADYIKDQADSLEMTVSKLIDIDDKLASVEALIGQLVNLTMAGPGNPGISAEDIRNFINAPGRTDREIIEAATKYGISGKQISDAMGVDPSVVNQRTGGASVSDDQIREFVNTPGRTVHEIHAAALQHGIDSKRLADAMGVPQSYVLDVAKSAGLAAFEKGSDYIPHDGIAMLHRGEAVTPAGHMKDMADEIKSLKNTVSKLLSELNSKTGALISTVVESSRENAKSIVEGHEDIARSEAWRRQASVEIR